MVRSVVRWLVRGLVRILFRVEVQGERHALAASPLLVIANHESFLDGLVLALFLPIDPVFVVHTGVLKSWFFRMVLSQIDHLSVDPSSPMAMKRVVRLLEGGRPVVIFPEGRITVTGSLMKVYDGPAFVAARTGATVVPVRLDGAARTYFSRLSGEHPRTFFPKIRLTVQPPARLSLREGGKARDRRREAGEQMRRLMQEMIFRSQETFTLYTTLLDAIRIHGRGRRVVEDIKQEEYSYGEVLKMTLALGRLSEKVTAPGEHVGILMPNLAATLCLIIGMRARGRIPALLNFTAGVDAMNAACTAAGLKTVISSRAFVDHAKLGEKIARLEGVTFHYLEDLEPTIDLRDRMWILFSMLRPRSAEHAQTAEEPAVILFTSGSEGQPKGVVLAHRAILSNIGQVRAVIPFSAEDKFLNVLPLFHSFGLTGGALLPLLTGSRVLLYASPLHYRVIPELAYGRSCTVLLGTSTFLGNYARFAHPYDFFKVRVVVAGAEKLSEAVRSTWFEKFGIRILEGYGATETAPVLALNTPMAYKTGTVGQLLPGIESKLVPVAGIESGGVLHVRGPNVMSGYYRAESPLVLQPPSSEAGLGWYDTGDVVEIDSDGFVRIVGRVKRFAKIAGEMISLEVAERIAVLAAPQALHAATALSDGARGESIVLLTTDPTLTRARLQEAARQTGLPEIAVPRTLIPVEQLPLLGTGKVDYVAVRRLAEAA